MNKEMRNEMSNNIRKLDDYTKGTNAAFNAVLDKANAYLGIMRKILAQLAAEKGDSVKLLIFKEKLIRLLDDELKKV